MVSISVELPAGCSNRSSNEAAGEAGPEAYPLGYVEDSVEPRTKLGTLSAACLEEGHRGKGHRRIVLIGNPAVVAQHLPFFRLDQSQQGVDGRESGDPSLVVLFDDVVRKLVWFALFDRLQHFQIMLHRPVEGKVGRRFLVTIPHAEVREFGSGDYTIVSTRSAQNVAQSFQKYFDRLPHVLI
jgi:hypothetical protein